MHEETRGTLGDERARQEAQLRQEMVRVGQLLHLRGYVAATDGNMTVRLGDDRLLVTPSGVSKGFMQPDQMILTDLEGRPPGAAAGAAARPSAELRLHLEAYRQRPDVRAVVHAHPPLCTALTVAGLSLEACVIPEVVMTLGTIPTVPYATPTTAEGPERARQWLRTRDALLLDRHGTLTLGQTLFEAYLKLEKMEHTAQIIIAAHQLGRVTTLTPEQMAKLIAIRKEHGWFREGDEDAFRRAMANGQTERDRFSADEAETLARLMGRLMVGQIEKGSA